MFVLCCAYHTHGKMSHRHFSYVFEDFMEYNDCKEFMDYNDCKEFMEYNDYKMHLWICVLLYALGCTW